MQLFVDMDGVLVDFDTGHERVFGYRSDKLADNVDWKAVRAVPDFYLNLPPMVDLEELWTHIKRHNPIVLTGVPWSVREAPENKRAWVRKHLGPHIEVRCCRSKEKCLHAAPGDILIDDWEKYRMQWIERAGCGSRTGAPLKPSESFVLSEYPDPFVDQTAQPRPTNRSSRGNAMLPAMKRRGAECPSICRS